MIATTPIEGRLPWVDYAKSLAMLMVVIIHVHITEGISKTLSAMIMPMFFMLSGYLFDYNRNPRFKPFAWKRTRQILIPYLCINVLMLGVWVIMQKWDPYVYSCDSDAWSLSKAIGLSRAPRLIHDVPLWALFCLYGVELVFYPLGRKMWSTLTVAAVTLGLSVAMFYTIPARMGDIALSVGQIITALPFYALGHAYRRGDVKERISRYVFSFPATLLYIMVFALTAHYNEYVSFRQCRFGSYPLFFLSSMSGSLGAIALMRYLAQAIGSNSIIRFISDITLLICGLHILVFIIIKATFYVGFGINAEAITEGWPGVAFTIAAFAITVYPISWVIYRYFRPLIGK